MACVVGWCHTICLSDSGEVYSFGKNVEGQLGLGHYDKVVHPTRIRTLSKIRSVSCGYHFTVCIDEEGIMWSFGENMYGQLGTGNTETKNVPQKILDIPPIQSVACGGLHTLLIDYDKNLWSVGNDCGQLALGTRVTNNKPNQTSFTNISKISGGYCFTMFQNETGEIYSCGNNSHGELGWETSKTNFADKYQIYQIYNQPPNIVQFCCGFYHSLFLDDEGKVFGVGTTTYGRLGTGNHDGFSQMIQIPNIPPIKIILCGGYSSYLVDFDGNVWSFGFGSSGQLGLGDRENRYFPTKIPTISEIVEISSGSFGYHFLAKNSQGEIFVVGDNEYGQLGKYSTEISLTPEIIKAEHFTMWGSPLKSRAKSARK